MKRKKSYSNDYLHQDFALKEAFKSSAVAYFLTFLTFLIFAFIAWAAFCQVNERVHATGEIEPVGNLINLQHFDGGIVNKIFVKEGDLIHKGQLLAILNGAGLEQDMQKTGLKLLALRLHAEVLQAIVNNKQPHFNGYTKDNTLVNKYKQLYKNKMSATSNERNILQWQRNQHANLLANQRSEALSLAKELEIATKMHDMYQNLSEQGHSSKIRSLDESRKLITLKRSYETMIQKIKITEHKVQEYQSRISSHRSSLRAKTNAQLSSVESEISQLAKQYKKLVDSVKRLNIYSPVNGIVKQASVKTNNEVIKPGTVVFDVVPTDKALVATVKVKPIDIATVNTGQSVLVKITAFDYIKHGVLPGIIYNISAASFKDQNKEPYYKAYVRLDKNYFIINNKKKFIIPGMLVDAEIVTRKRSVLEYLLKPVYNAINSGMAER